MEPRKSEVDIVQAAGRAMRLDEKNGKKLGYVLVPAFISTVNGMDDDEITKAINEAGYETIAEVLGAMADQDEGLDIILKQLKAKPDGDGLVGDCSSFFDYVSVIGQALEVKDIERSIRIEVVDRLVPDWWARYYELATWIDIHRGHLPRRDVANQSEAMLGSWIGNQRAKHKSGVLPSDRIRALEVLPGWSWHPRLETWSRMLTELQEFRRKSPNSWPSPDQDEELCKWVSRQRTEFSQGNMSADKSLALESISGWYWNRHDWAWDNNFNELIAYLQSSSGLFPTAKGPASEAALARWISAQRNTWAKGMMDEERAMRLQQIAGWAWSVKSDTWMEKFEAVKMFLEAHEGEWPRFTSRNHVESGLAQWMLRQRQDKSKGTLDPIKVGMLEGISGWKWDRDDDPWEDNLRKLSGFLASSGGAYPKSLSSDASEAECARWVSSQRQKRRIGALSEDQLRRLEALPDWSWNTLDRAWERGLEALHGFLKENGGRWPTSNSADATERKSSEWIAMQRDAYKRGVLETERVQRLEAVKGWVWVVRDTQWYETLEEFKAFRFANNQKWPSKHSGDQTEKALGQWYFRQRRLHDNGKLSAERVAELEKIPDWSWEETPKKWNDSYGRLVDFVRINGRMPKANGSTVEEKSLLVWAKSQKSLYRKNGLSKRNISRLEAVDGWEWQSQKDRIDKVELWHKHFAELKDFLATRKRWPSSWKSGEAELALSLWIGDQRKAYKSQGLDNECVRLLNSVDGWMWDPLSETWEKSYEDLTHFLVEHGKWPSVGSASKSERSLREWIKTQRYYHDKGIMSDERRTRLLMLKGWTWQGPLGPHV